MHTGSQICTVLAVGLEHQRVSFSGEGRRTFVQAYDYPLVELTTLLYDCISWPDHEDGLIKPYKAIAIPKSFFEGLTPAKSFFPSTSFGHPSRLQSLFSDFAFALFSHHTFITATRT